MALVRTGAIRMYGPREGEGWGEDGGPVGLRPAHPDQAARSNTTRHAAIWPDWFTIRYPRIVAPSTRPWEVGTVPGRVVLVCGPPCAGKSTYVRAHAQPGDVVLDQDIIGAKAMGRALGTLPPAQGTAWVIRSAPGAAKRAALAKRLRAEVVLLVPDLEELMARARQRTDARRAIRSIRSWLEAEQRNAAPRVRRFVLAKTTERGYGADHQRLRAATIDQAYGQPCTRCGQPMVKGQPLDLDHDDDRSGYRGFSHRSCNRQAGAIKRNSRRRADLGEPRTSRDW